MNILRHKHGSRSVSKALTALLAILAASACNDDAPTDWVDLRFRAEDAYELSAESPEPIRLQVKSTKPWSVTGVNDKWCEITPGDGPAGETYDVTVQYSDNTELDDRLDTITVRSDYWVGKTVTVRQKGLAYLRTEDAEGIEIQQTGGSAQFTIAANQNWSAELDPEAKSWLTVNSELKGHGNATVNFSAGDNRGERRYATFTIFDRHGIKAAEVTVAQIGVQLDPAETLLKTDFKAKELSIDVVSNIHWTAELEDPETTWLTFDKAEFDGSATLAMRLGEHTGMTIRNATIILKSKPEAGATQVVRRIILRQANDPIPEHYEFNLSEKAKWSVNQGSADFADDDVTFTPGRLLRYGFRTGNYKFRIKSMDADANPTLYICKGNFEIRFHLSAASKKTDVSVRNNGTKFKADNISFNPGEPHTVEVRMDRTENEFIKFSWLLDGTEFNTYTADGSDGSELTPEYGSEFSIFVGCYKGTVCYDWWEYQLPYCDFDWGD